MNTIDEHYKKLSQSQNFENYKLLAFDFANNDRYIECLYFIDAALKQRTDVDLIKLKGSILLKIGDTKACIRVIEDLRKDHPEDCHFLEIGVLFCLSRIEESASHCHTYIDTFSKGNKIKPIAAHTILDVVIRSDDDLLLRKLMNVWPGEFDCAKMHLNKLNKSVRSLFLSLIKSKINQGQPKCL